MFDAVDSQRVLGLSFSSKLNFPEFISQRFAENEGVFNPVRKNFLIDINLAPGWTCTNVPSHQHFALRRLAITYNRI